jgi:NAD(P)-dependent dehydrogenase (short-subunit alcohol dehydrogenase family)
MINKFLLEGKKILITGASSGIGKSTAIVCSQLGAQVIITGRNLNALNETFEQLSGIGHNFYCGDLNNEQFLQDLCNTCPAIDGLVNSAGINLNVPFKFTKKDDFINVMKTNFETPTLLLQSLLKQKKVSKKSSIVFVSSISGITCTATGISIYSASKGAISSIIRVLAQELASNKVRVNAVCPGMVKTEMTMNNTTYTKEQLEFDEKNNYPLGYGIPEDVALTISFLLSDASSWITGTNLIIDGGASTH